MTALQARFTEPENWQWGRITPRGDEFLRHGWIIPPNPRAVAFILPGLSEHIEKYFETIRDLLDRKFAVAIVEWRGHGLSWRYPQALDYRHNDTFDNDLADAALWLDTMAANPALQNLPKIMLAHSMGSHLGLRLLHDRPGQFACAILNAPLQGIPVRFDGTTFLWFIANLLKWLVPLRATGPNWSEQGFNDINKQLTSDPTRIALKHHWLTVNPGLRTGPVTFGWVASAINSMRQTNQPSYLAAIKTPILITKAENDYIVSNVAIDRAFKGLPNAALLQIEGALHEVLMERDTYRNRFWHAFDAFVAKHLQAG